MAIYHDDFTIRDVEVYARAIEDVLDAFGIGGSGKSYDPLTIEQITTAARTKFIAHSYAFDLWDGGRHHEAESLEQIWKGILEEAVRELKQHVSHRLGTSDKQVKAFMAAFDNPAYGGSEDGYP